MHWADIWRYVVVGTMTSMVSVVVMLVRERNSFSTKMMDLFIADKNSWVAEREKLEHRIDVLYEGQDKLRDKYEQLLQEARHTPS